MKRLQTMLIIIGIALACAFLGAGSLIINTSSAMTAETAHANPNYFYLSNPKMLTMDTNFTYVVNQTETNAFELIALNLTGSLNNPIRYPLSAEPAFIKCTGNIIFLFYEDGFTALTYANGTFAPRTASKVSYPTGYGTIEFFDVFFISNTNTYRIFFASKTHYGWADYRFAGSGMVTPTLSSSHGPVAFTAFNKITAIACDKSDFLYICASEQYYEDDPPYYYIYQLSQTSPSAAALPINPGYLLEFTSFTVIPNRDLFVYINQSGSLTLFNRNSDKPPFSEPLLDTGNLFKTNASRKPIFTASEGQTSVLVIDEEKHSIDRYLIASDGSALIYQSIIAGYRGGDSGFFNRPTSITHIDSSLRKSPITSSEYLITDRAGQIMYNSLDETGKTTSRPFLSDTSTRFSDNVRAAYDNYDTVYIYDYDVSRLINRVRTFTLDGKYKEREFTGFGGQVTSMFADSARTVYVLDATKNSIFYYSPTTMHPAQMSLLPAFEAARGSASNPNFTIMQSAHGVYNEQLEAIILSSVKTAGVLIKTLILPLDGSTPRILDVTSELIVDVTVDALGNIILLTSESSKYFLSLFRLREDFIYETSPAWKSEIDKTTVDPMNTSLSIDYINRRILYIGAHHAIESLSLSDAQIQGWGDFVPAVSWKDNSAALMAYSPDGQGSVPIFAKADADTVIYEYPGFIRALALAPKNAVFKVLDYESNYILYENGVTGDFILGFVSGKTVSAAEPYIEPDFTEARVMFSLTQVFKYPTSDRRAAADSGSSELLTLEKNFQQSDYEYGLQLSKRVALADASGSPHDVTDVHGFAFYEIRLSKNPNGKYSPDSKGLYVGYVNVNNVIDYWLAPSTKRFVPNASIRILSSHNTDKVQVYELTQTDGFVELQHEFFLNKQAVRIIKEVDQYTYVQYDDPAVGSARARFGWVETKYVVPDGLSALQLIAIAALALVALAGITFAAVYIKKRLTHVMD